LDPISTRTFIGGLPLLTPEGASAPRASRSSTSEEYSGQRPAWLIPCRLESRIRPIWPPVDCGEIPHRDVGLSSANDGGCRRDAPRPLGDTPCTGDVDGTLGAAGILGGEVCFCARVGTSPKVRTPVLPAAALVGALSALLRPSILARRRTALDRFRSLMGQEGKLFLAIDAFGMPVFSARSLALDGVSWVQGGEVENAVGWVSRVRQNRRRRLLPPLGVAPCGSSIRPPVFLISGPLDWCEFGFVSHHRVHYDPKAASQSDAGLAHR